MLSILANKNDSEEEVALFDEMFDGRMRLGARRKDICEVLKG